jgi:D-tyrosyl-tRNA(Tyr) deacylase
MIPMTVKTRRRWPTCKEHVASLTPLRSFRYPDLRATGAGSGTSPRLRPVVIPGAPADSRIGAPVILQLPAHGGVNMRAVVQRVKEAWVRVDGEEVARIGAGLLILVGVAAADGPEDVAFLAQKLAHLRVFAGDGRLMHLSLLDLKAEVLLVSQFTILGDCRKGRRPSFDGSATPEMAEKLYEDLVQAMSGYGLRVATGRFRQMMDVGLINDGPVTLLLDSKKVF